MLNNSNISISFWEQTTFLKQVDYLIIGSGIVGLNAAIHLKELAPKSNVLLLERAAIPQGASTKNAGFACFGSPTELLEDLQSHSEAEVWSLVEQRWRGLQKMRSKIGDQAIDYQYYNGYELFRENEQSIFERCLDKLPEFNHAFKELTGEGEAFRLRNERIDAFRFQHISNLIESQLEGQLHPAKMIQALQQLAKDTGVQMLYGVTVESIEKEKSYVEVHCENGWKFKSSKVLLTVNGFAKRLLPELSLQPARNQVLVTKPIVKLAFKGCFHYDRGYYYFRNIGNRILLGGGRNLTPLEEQTDQFGHTTKIQNALLELLENVILPDQKFEIEQWWSGILGVGKQKKPIVEMIEPNLGIAVRLGGMGVAIGTQVGESAAEMLVRG
ncbi:MAG: FAD-dependent oxidoreductase [Bacteroidota bacterium]